MRSWLALFVVVGALSGCNEPPTIRDVVAADVTDSEVGPYEVRATASSPDGYGASRLLIEDRDAVAFVVDSVVGGRLEARFIGALPGHPTGSVIRYALEVCDAAGACVVDPAGFPADARELRVGRVPSSPRVDSLAPVQGPASGGTVVDIVGDDFRDDVAVFFGEAPAARVERSSSSTLRAVTPPHAVGPVDVVVVNSDDEAAVVVAGFRFLPAPVIFDVAPREGPTAGGTAIEVSGEGFVVDDRVFVDGVSCRDVVVVSDTSITCATPPGRAGLVDIAVEAPDGGRDVVVEAFLYRAAPRVDGVQPDSGNSEGGTRVVIAVDDVEAGAVVSIGGAACVDVVIAEDRVECTTTAAEPGVADVVITNPDGQSGVLPGGYGYLGPPLVLEVVPDIGPFAGGIEVRLRGAGLANDDVVSFDGVDAEVLDSIDDLELVVLLPPTTAPLSPAPADGLLAVDVRVRRVRADDTREVTIVDGFHYRWPPEVIAVVPGSGPTIGGTVVVVSGRFFSAGMAISFDGSPCRDLVVIDSTTARCVTPPGEAGPADVVAGDVDGSEGVVAVGAFVYVPPPRVDSITPAQGPTFGGERVTIRGGDFREGAVVLIDGAACTVVDVVDSNTITCSTPPGARGPADVTVINPDGQRDTAVGIYRYVGVDVVPDHGLPVGFTRVVVRAAGLQPGVVFTFGGVVATCERRSSTQAICQTPARPGTGVVDVRFRNPDGTTDADPAFRYTSFVEDGGDRFDSIGRNANDIVIIDVDDDGADDVIIANGRVGIPESSELYRNTGARFARTDIADTFITANTVDVGTINNDDVPDLIFGASDTTGAVLLASSGPARWTPIDLNLSAENSAFDAQLADLIGDARDDLLVLGIGCDVVLDQATNPGCDPQRFGHEVLFEQNGVGGGSRLARREGQFPIEPRQTHDHKMVIFDVDGDGDNDVFVVVNNEPYTSAQHRLLRNRVDEGRGFVKETAPFTAIVGDLYDVDSGDIDGDGDDDVVTGVCLGDDAVSTEVILRNDNGTLRHDELALPGPRLDCTIGSQLVDVDSDGDLDLLYTGTNDARFDQRLLTRLYVNRGDGTFVDGSAALPAPDTILQGNTIAGADLDDDGDIDLVLAGGAPYADVSLAGAVLFFEQR